MPSAWHTPDDPREYGDPPVDERCDNCGEIVRVAAEDWRDGENFCWACVGKVVSRPHPVDEWPTDIPAA